MKRVRRALPSIRFSIATVAICLVVGVLLAGGFHPRALLGLLLAGLFLALITLRNYDPMAWEAMHEPETHSMRLQRDAAETRLRSVVAAFDGGDDQLVAAEMERARELLSERRLSTKAR